MIRADVPGRDVVKRPLNAFIDHTLLRPDATREEIAGLCAEAIEYRFASVCLSPCWVPYASKALQDTDVLVCSVAGFPLGSNTTAAKLFETEQLIASGAREVDCVMNIGFLKSGNAKGVADELSAIVALAGSIPIKVIIETCLLTDEEKTAACLIAKDAGVAFVKTSTGFSKGGATLHDVALMRKTVGPQMGVKASGGIRDYGTALKMIEAGATRLGTSSGIAIVSP